MKRFILTTQATQDLNDIWDYIAGDSLEAADRVLDALENTMIRLSKTPGMGHWREVLTDKRHRFFLVYSYLIATGTRRSRCRSSGFSTPHGMCKASLD